MKPMNGAPASHQRSLRGRPFGVEIQHLLAFLSIYEERQVTLAAQRLGRSQSALSHSLSRLRELLRDELFVPRGGEMWPTQVAQQLHPTIQSAVALIDSLHEERRLFDPLHDSFELRIGMTDYAERVFSPRLWMALERRAPGVRLTVRAIDRYAAEGMLLGDAVDMAIVGNPVLTDAALQCDDLLADPYVVAFSRRAHSAGMSRTAAPKANSTAAEAEGVPVNRTAAPEADSPATEGEGTSMSLPAYLAAPHLRVAVGQGEYSAVDAVLKAAGHRRDIRCIVPSFLRVPAMIEGSGLVATLARGVFSDLEGTARDALVLQPPPFEIDPVRIVLLSPGPERASSAQRWLRDLVLGLGRAS